MKNKVMKLSIKDEAGNSGMAVFKRELNKDYPLHFHDFFELEYIVSGSGTTYINSTAYPIKAGSTIFVAPLDFQSIQVDKPMIVITTNFIQDWIDKNLVKFCENTTVIDDIPSNYFDLLYYEYNNANGFAIRNILNCIVYYATSRFPDNSPKKAGDVLNMMAHFINTHYDETINLNALSKKFGYTPNYLSNLFHNSFDKTIKEFITDVRINESVKMLLSTDNSVTNICFDCGFQSLATFLRVFKSRYNMTPSEYRKLYNSVKERRDENNG